LLIENKMFTKKINQFEEDQANDKRKFADKIRETEKKLKNYEDVNRTSEEKVSHLESDLNEKTNRLYQIQDELNKYKAQSENYIQKIKFFENEQSVEIKKENE